MDRPASATRDQRRAPGRALARRCRRAVPAAAPVRTAARRRRRAVVGPRVERDRRPVAGPTTMRMDSRQVWRVAGRRPEIEVRVDLLETLDELEVSAEIDVDGPCSSSASGRSRWTSIRGASGGDPRLLGRGRLKPPTRPTLPPSTSRCSATSWRARRRRARSTGRNGETPVSTPNHVASLADLETLPFTEKHELQAAQASAPPVRLQPGGRARTHWCGCRPPAARPGTPLRMAMTRSDIAVYNEVGARAAWAAGLRPGDILFECMNYALYAGGVNDHGTFETLGACVARVGVGQSRRLLEILSDLGVPAALYSTPSYALHLATVAREEGRRPARPRAAAGPVLGRCRPREPGVPRRDRGRVGHDRRGASTARARRRPSPRSATRPTGSTGWARSPFSPSSSIRRAGAAVAAEDGATAELVITTLRREAHPLIRFRTHDHRPADDDAVPLRPDRRPVPRPRPQRRHVHRPRHQRVSAGRRGDRRRVPARR